MDDAWQQPLGLTSAVAACPWCGEVLEWVVDPANHAAYVEDCYVCCRPCVVRPQLDAQGELASVEVERE